MSKATKYVEPGACFVGGDFKKCALDSTFCDKSSNEEYVSPAKLELNDWSIPCKNVENIAVGKCYSNLDNSACTGHVSSCILPRFLTAGSVSDTGCSVTHNKNRENDSSVSIYGACVDQKTQNQKCYWSIDDCPNVPNINAFVPGSAQHSSAHYSPAKLCTCEKTLIGACSYPSGYTCAVSKDACDIAGQYITAAQLEADPLAPTCYLCPPFGKSNFHKIQKGRSQKEKGLIALSVIGIVALLLVALCAYKRCSRRRLSSEKEWDRTSDETNEELDEKVEAEGKEQDVFAGISA